MSPRYKALSMNEYQLRDPPLAKGSPFEKVFNYIQNQEGSDYGKRSWSTRRSTRSLGQRFAWVRVRALGGKTNLWGRLSLRLSDLDFKAASRDGYGVDWPISYKDIAPYYDQVDRLLGISGHPEGLPHLPDSIFQRPVKLTKAELHVRRKIWARWDGC